MSSKLKKILFSLLFFCSIGFFITKPLLAGDLSDKIKEYEKKIGELQGEQRTLSAAIAYLDNKIKLTTTQIFVTEEELKILGEEISKLSVKIGILDQSLVDVSEILSSRIQETYKRSLINPVYFFFSSKGFGEALSRIQYLRVVQKHDRDLLYQMQKSKMNYGMQKELKEEKQEKEEVLKAQLLSQQVVLDQQKGAKQELLNVTKNDEQEYQQLLAVARAEYQAIQSILAGYGEETKVREVKEGEKIATVLSGSSCNSSGTHLHFMVVKNGNPENPFGYLKSVSFHNCSGWYDGQCQAIDAFNPSGGWNWPLDPEITLNQGYGYTWAVQNTWVGQIYSSHNGIDIEGSSNNVKSVKAGTLYKGSYSVGCVLPYVKVEHGDSDIDTYYLHVYY